MRVTNIVYRIRVFVVSPLNMKSLTSPRIFGNEPTRVVIYKDITFSNCIWNFTYGHLNLGGGKLEFDTRLVIKAKYPTFPWFTEP